MAISFSGLTFYRPSATVTVEVFKDDNGAIIGKKDIVTITDKVTSNDVSDLGQIAKNVLDKSKNPIRTSVSYPTNSSTFGKIKSVSFSEESNFIDLLVYTVVVEAESISPLNNPVYGFTNQNSVRSFSVSEKFDIPYDLESTSILGDTYYNKTATYTSSVSIRCEGRGNKTANQNSLDVLKSFLTKTVSVERLGTLAQDYDPILSSITKNESSDGTISATVTVLYLPNDSTAKVLYTQQIVQNQIQIPEAYNTRSYTMTFQGLASPTYDSNHDFVTPASKFDIAQSAGTSFLALLTGKNHPTTDTFNGKINEEVCVLQYPAIDASSNCYNTRKVSIQQNQSDGTYTINIEQSTEPFNCDLDGYQVDYNIVKKEDQQVHVEVHGWNNPNSIIQDMQTKKADTHEYTVSVTDLSKCGGGSALVDKAKAKFLELAGFPVDVSSPSNQIISSSINLSANKCSLKATVHKGVDGRIIGDPGNPGV